MGWPLCSWVQEKARQEGDISRPPAGLTTRVPGDVDRVCAAVGELGGLLARFVEKDQAVVPAVWEENRDWTRRVAALRAREQGGPDFLGILSMKRARGGGWPCRKAK